jgi:hypothetical protein
MIRLLRSFCERHIVEPPATFPAPINAPTKETFDVVPKRLSRDSADVAREALGTDVAQRHILKALPTIPAVIYPPTQDSIQMFADVSLSHSVDVAGGTLRTFVLHRCKPSAGGPST